MSVFLEIEEIFFPLKYFVFRMRKCYNIFMEKYPTNKRKESTNLEKEERELKELRVE